MLVAFACSAANPSTPGTSPSASTSDGAAHPMRADKLKSVMKSFDAAVRKNVPGQVDEHDRWEGVYPRIADAAAELEASANALAGHPPKGLELPARGRFQVRGRALQDAATNLKEAAARNDADAVATARAQVAEACRDCHREFRSDSKGIPEAFE
jgi:hypothetical protein